MEKHILNNGLTLLIDHRTADAVTIGILVKVGSNDERLEERGIAHFLEHMLFEGTTTKSAKELTSAIENIGGESNATTTNERTFFYVTVPKKHVALAIAMLADMFQNASFPKDAFEKEKSIILDEIKMLHDDPKAYQWIIFLQHLFTKNRTRLPVYGDVSCIKKLSREKVMQFYKKYYTTRNSIITVCGNVPDIKKKIERAFSKLRSTPVQRWKNPEELFQKHPVEKTLSKDIHQTYILFGYKTSPAHHKDSPVLDVIKALLDRGQSSRLFDEIRTKRGLAYAVGAAHEANSTYGYFVVAVMTQKRNREEVRSLIREITQLPKLTAAEVAIAKEYVEGSIVVAHEHNLERAERNAIWEIAGTNYENYCRAIRQVTQEDVARVVRTYFTQNYTETILEQKN